MESIQRDVKAIVQHLIEEEIIQAHQLFVIGCSTSEVAGERIGTSGSEHIAAILYEEFQRLQEATGAKLAFQGCEHINRALVLEQETAERRGLEAVSVVPVPGAGGSMASYAYKQFQSPVVVEHIKADAGIDIGDTFIGMHLKHVAVPIRLSNKQIGKAHVTCAKTRPKLIGGARAEYQQKGNDSVTCDE
ncbi:TIGR01440 family protein [Pontibacillus salicampi]|uniref:UPF0340 protein ACFFGV_16740 n=1 Tax=Pontibacillus salicampi TaxID=1449801 RepID=A0ABV6LS44_9BACI